MRNTLEVASFTRRFQVWDYQVSHGQLLIRSPQCPATNLEPEQKTNIDLIFWGVKYLSLPAVLNAPRIVAATDLEVVTFSKVVGQTLSADSLHVLYAQEQRHIVIADKLLVYENDWDIFESPLEFRSQYRGDKQ